MKNLSQRIITSAVLLFILAISLFYNKYIWLFVLILASLILFIELNNLVKKIWKKKKKNRKKEKNKNKNKTVRLYDEANCHLDYLNL